MKPLVDNLISNLLMLSGLISVVNSLLYTALAFIVPLYFTLKALLRQYSVSIVAPTSFASASIIHESSDDSEVPSVFIEPVVESVKASINESFNKSSTLTSSTSSTCSTNWIYYWALLAVLHCLTGAYERVLLPLFGNALLYYSAKYAAIYWLAKEDARVARSLWNSLLAPLVAKHEKDVDRAVQVCGEQGRALFAKSINTLRQTRSKLIKVKAI